MTTGPLERRVLARPTNDRPTECALILCEYDSPEPFTVEKDGVTYTLVATGMSVSQGRLVVQRVECDPPPPVPLNPPYVFVNPPLKVWDATGCKEDPLAAVREIVSDAVLRDPG
jgi:hypothetical protein